MFQNEGVQAGARQVPHEMDAAWGSRADALRAQARVRWFQPAEILEILSNHEKLGFALSEAPPHPPTRGSVYLFDKKDVNFRADGVNWVRKKGENRTREDHVKLRINGVPSISGAYTHSADVPVRARARHAWSLSRDRASRDRAARPRAL